MRLSEQQLTRHAPQRDSQGQGRGHQHWHHLNGGGNDDPPPKVRENTIITSYYTKYSTKQGETINIFAGAALGGGARVGVVLAALHEGRNYAIASDADDEADADQNEEDRHRDSLHSGDGDRS